MSNNQNNSVKAIPNRCPYATLNLPSTGESSDQDWSFTRKAVSDDEIRDAYKRLSRLLHPDKRPPGRERDAAQEIFTELMDAYEILSDPVLRQAYDHFGHRAVAQIRHDRYNPSSLYLSLSNLHRHGKTREALETLTTLMENGVRQQRHKEWELNADVEVKLHVNPAGSDEIVDVSETSVSFTSAVPIPEPEKQKMQLSIGGRTSVQKGMGSTRGVLTALYRPSQQTFVSSDLTFGRHHIETSLSSIQHMSSGTVVSAKVTRSHDFENDDNRNLSFGFTSSRSLSLIEGRKVHGMFALNFGWNPPTSLKLQYGQLSLTTWGLWANETSNNQVETKDDDESDTKSHNSANTARSSKPDPQKESDLASEHPTKLTANLALGQFPIEIGIEQDYFLDSPERSAEASISYNPFIGAFRVKSMLSRDLSQTTSISVGVSHSGMKGLTWLFQYERPELTLSIPIFVTHFMDPNYWNRLISLYIFSYLIDETLGDMLEFESKDSEDELNIHETIAIKEKRISEEQQWMSSSYAKSSCSQQMLLIEPIARLKREIEESRNGLVILCATYEWLPSSYNSSVRRISIDVTQSLQFWVQDSRLILPAHSKRTLLGFRDVSPHKGHRVKKNVHVLHDAIDFINNFLECFGIGQTNSQDERGSEEKVSSEIDGSTLLTIRYRYDGITYEIVINDENGVSLPSKDALVMGSAQLLKN